ncbi:MAG TPA: universal stress protein [Solirubrobacterales bacterium]
MQDDFQPGIDSLEELDGVTPPIFRRVLLAAGDDSTWSDAVALSRALAGQAEAVTVADAADLIVIGSGPEATPGRTGLDRAGEKLVEGARCPVAVAPRGLAGRDDYELRRIDVGIDGSREAAAALTVAAHLARAHDARLRLVAVAELGFDLGGAPRPPDPREVERLGRHLDNAGDGLPGIWVEAYLREGSADQILIGLSREADLLVLGSQAAYGDGGHVSLGEAATRILRAAACPTLVVPAP